MTPVERLLAIEDIRKLVARFARVNDKQLLDELPGLIADDAEIHIMNPDSPPRTERGKETIVAKAKSFLGLRMIHLVSAAEIDFDSDHEAHGIWRQLVGANPPGDLFFSTLHYGFVHIEGAWVIKYLRVEFDMAVKGATISAFQ